jgi:hypothetical protein
MPRTERFRVWCFRNTRASSTLCLADTISPNQIFTNANVVRLLHSDGDVKFKTAGKPIARNVSGRRLSFSSNGLCSHMDNLSGYANRPLAFVLHYLRQRLPSHVVILTAVVAAVACSVGTQYGVKFLVDGLAAGPAGSGGVWLAFIFLMSLITADNFLGGSRAGPRVSHL